MKEGYAVVSRFIGSHNLSKGDRQAEDYYATDPVAAEWLLKIEDLQNDIWECACGEGHLAKVFQNAGKNVKCTDLIDRNFGVGGGGFPKNVRDMVGRYCDKSPVQICSGVYRTRLINNTKRIKGVHVPKSTVFGR